MLPLLSTGLCHACEINSRKQVFQKAGRQGQPLILLWKVFLILEALKHETKSLLFLALKYFKYHHQTWSLITVFLLNNSSHFSPAALCVPSTNWKNFTNIISNLISNLTGFLFMSSVSTSGFGMLNNWFEVNTDLRLHSRLSGILCLYNWIAKSVLKMILSLQHAGQMGLMYLLANSLDCSQVS